MLFFSVLSIIFLFFGGIIGYWLGQKKWKNKHMAFKKGLAEGLQAASKIMTGYCRQLNEDEKKRAEQQEERNDKTAAVDDYFFPEGGISENELLEIITRKD